MAKRVSEDAAAISELMKRHEGPLLRYVRKFVGCPDRARDIVQAAFMKLAVQKSESLNGHAAAWLYTVCRREAIDVRRKESRMISEAGVAIENRVVEAAGPETVAETREEMGLAERLVSELPENQQEVVRLKFGGGLSYKEIAEVTHLSVSNVGFLLHTAIATIRNQMNPNAERQGIVR